ncbi:MAG: peptidoglycan DD-metalloendopeptidase family protein [Syntrophobacterales bacterium]|jgi:septal ring factor EnvC (AmiA/AmiB activator)
MSRLVVALIVVLLCVEAPVVSAEKVGKTNDNVRVHKEKVKEVQKEIKRGQAHINEMRQKERLILDQLDQMELQLQLIRDNLEKRRRERTLLRKEIAEKRKKLKQLDRELEKLRALLAQRLEALYKFSRHAYLNILVSARDVSGFQHQWVYLRAVAEQDSALIGQFIKRQQEEEKLTQALTSREEKLGRLMAKIGQEVAELEKVKREQVALLQDVHNQEEMYQNYVTELAAVSRELKNKIEELQRKSGRSKAKIQPKGGFASKKGALPYPVQGKIKSRFGPKKHKKFGTKIRSNGIEITTEPLSPVVAVYGGQVLYSEWVKGYGKVIIIDHGDKYYTLTAHLAEVLKETGATVESGDIIGYAGYSPTVQSGGRVYFEIRHLGKAINPEAWLLPALASAAAATAR